MVVVYRPADRPASSRPSGRSRSVVACPLDSAHGRSPPREGSATPVVTLSRHRGWRRATRRRLSSQRSRQTSEPNHPKASPTLEGSEERRCPEWWSAGLSMVCRAGARRACPSSCECPTLQNRAGSMSARSRRSDVTSAQLSCHSSGNWSRAPWRPPGCSGAGGEGVLRSGSNRSIAMPLRRDRWSSQAGWAAQI